MNVTFDDTLVLASSSSYDIGSPHGELETSSRGKTEASAVDLPCSGSVELTLSCMCCVLRTTCFQCTNSECYTHYPRTINEFISQNYHAADLDW